MYLVVFTVKKINVWLSWSCNLQYEALIALWKEKVPDPWPRVSYFRLLVDQCRHFLQSMPKMTLGENTVCIVRQSSDVLNLYILVDD